MICCIATLLLDVAYCYTHGLRCVGHECEPVCKNGWTGWYAICDV